MADIGNTGAAGNSPSIKFGGQRPVSKNQQTITGPVTKRGEVSPRTNEAMDSTSRSAAKRLITPWVVKVVGASVAALGALASFTGAGASIGVPMMMIGGAIYGLGSAATAVDAGRYASNTGNSVTRGVMKDIGISVALPIVAVVTVVAIVNDPDAAANIFASAGTSAAVNREPAQDSGGDG